MVNLKSPFFFNTSFTEKHLTLTALLAVQNYYIFLVLFVKFLERQGNHMGKKKQVDRA